MKLQWGAIVAVIAASLGGCSGQLIVYDGGQKEVKGMPFRTAEVYVKQGTHDRSSAGVPCAPTEFQEILSLPTGAQYYVTATSSSFAKTAFSLKYNAAGGVSEVGLDSEPAGAENIKAMAELVKTIAPLGGLGARQAITDTSKKVACDVGEVRVTYERLESYMTKHPAP